MKILITILIVATMLLGCNPTSSEGDANMPTKIQFIRNATMRIEYAGKTILTDPYLSEKGSLAGFFNPSENVNPMQELPLTKEEIVKNADFILVSHTHIPAEEPQTAPSDHFDSAAISYIAKDFPIYAQEFDVAGLERVGFSNVTKIENQITVDGIKITRFNGKHVDIDALLPLVGESSGYVLQAENQPTILWTGDTILTDEVKAAISEFNPDIIITHSGGAQLPIDAEGNVATLLLDAESTIEIAKLAPQAKIVAIHMEALDHCPVTRDDVRNEAEAQNVSDRVITPELGEVLTF
jgi:L-ascorbate metabolism protein UlaG (beta-lactamase superfamily)